MKSISFIAPGNPCPANDLYGRAPNGRVFKTARARAYQDLVAGYGRRARAAAGLATFIGEVRVTIRFVFASPLSDDDGPSKLVLDALQLPDEKRSGAAIYRNDRQVKGGVTILPSACDPAAPRTEVTVEALDEVAGAERERAQLKRLVRPPTTRQRIRRALRPSMRSFRG